MQEKYDDRVTVFLAIESSDFPPPVLTAQLGASPDRQWAIGDIRGRTGKRWERSGWVIEATSRSSEQGGRCANELIAITIRAFEQRIAPLVEAISLLGSAADKYVVLAVEAEVVPGIELSREFLSLLARLGGTFQIDLRV